MSGIHERDTETHPALWQVRNKVGIPSSGILLIHADESTDRATEEKSDLHAETEGTQQQEINEIP